MVDGTDKSSVCNSVELFSYIQHFDCIRGKPVAIAITKSDNELRQVTVADLTAAGLQLQGITAKEFKLSAQTGAGIDSMLTWLSSVLKTNDA